MAGVQDILNSPHTRTLIGDVRLFLRDFPELNRLTEGVDHSNRHIAWAILDAVSDWSSTPPFLISDLDTLMERNWRGLFIRGVVISLLESLMILHMRNYLAYSDGGINVQTENPQMIQAALQLFKNNYEQKKLRALQALNIEWALDGDGLHSEYAYVNNLLGPW